MTRQQNKYKNIFILLCVLLVIISLVGGYLINHYTRSRMGMQRHVVYLNNKWEKILPIDLLIKIARLGQIILTIGLIGLFAKSKKNLNKKILFSLSILLNIWFLYFISFNNIEKNRAYYLLSICFLISSIFQSLIYIMNS